ncbi:FecR family protein [Sinomicrobium soli]|uniref:FecR family protein n=1 Tax=Sinomicrobium sp. N-1-3-6 TaxID=2219864 RepID=UPI000DCD5D8A|nr:FecR family protein [Sinomicrobium sp. N-1-3-6]RAV30797.1 iron dicitrate transport regulator FecR [Sinomicrobium sp. N-1-3-6]
MIHFDKMVKTAIKLADMILRGKRIERTDIEGDLFSDEDRDYVIEHLSDPVKIEAQHKIAKELCKTRDKDWKKIEAAIRPPDKKVRYLYSWARIAAVFAGFIAIGYFFFRDHLSGEPPADAVAGEQHITLRLPDGSITVLEETADGAIKDRSGGIIGVRRGRSINYRKTEKAVNTTVPEYHEIQIPFGKTFELILSDGTTVNLNAGSSLKYPIHFTGEGNRQVFLEGEAYFDVEKNPEQPFVVETDGINIQVLGTRFVVNSYKEESRIHTVLLEGSVALFEKGKDYNPEKAPRMVPGQKATWDKTQKDISFEDVDTGVYTGWIEGKLIFNHVVFGEILRRLERYYDIAIINKNKNLDKEIFTAGFEGESVENILNYFGRNYPFEYTVRGDSIVISP